MYGKKKMGFCLFHLTARSMSSTKASSFFPTFNLQTLISVIYVYSVNCVPPGLGGGGGSFLILHNTKKEVL